MRSHALAQRYLSPGNRVSQSRAGNSPYQLENPARCIAWASSFGLLPDERAVKKAAHIHVEKLSLLTYPTTKAAVREICTDMLMWFFIADDQFDERAVGARPWQMEEVCANFLEILEVGKESTAVTPLGRSLLNLRVRLRRQASARWLRRFTWNMYLYLQGCLQESKNRANGYTPNFVEYREIRRKSVGTYPCFDLGELALPELLSDETATQPALSELRHTATDVIAWLNDIVSYSKEAAFNDPHNILPVLMAESQIGLKQALDATHDLYRADMRSFRRQAQALMQESANPLLHEYIAGLESWICGVRTWSFRSQRYSRDYLLLSQRSKHELIATTH